MSDEPEQAASAPARVPTPVTDAISIAVGVTIATGIVMGFAFNPERAGTPAMLISIGLLYALFTALALQRMHKRGELRERMRPAGGDLTLGAVVAGVLYGGAHLVEHAVAAHGSVREAWMMRLYLQIGDPDAQGRVLVGGAVFVVAALEEMVWRGLVMRALQAAYGWKKALVWSSLLFAVAHLPTVYLLRDPTAGYNPLIVLAAGGCSFVWGLVYVRTKRLVPAVFAHAFFSWAVVEFPIWRP
jgi:uncharacterized protein